MSSRFPPSSGESRYAPRDRSPPRFNDRRASVVYGPTLASRVSEASYRPNEAPGYAGMGRDLPREPPRGPKALVDSSRGGGFPPRGRGFAGRGEFRDRDFRDSRDVPAQRREADRDWNRRDHLENRDRRPSPAGRNRSRSPQSRDFRDFQPRDLDLNRLRRDSRDGPLSATSSISDAPQSAGFFGRGVFRGRGRGDWDLRGRGRGIHPEDRDTFQPRSRSRDRIWERDFREERSRDHEREPDRRDDDSRHSKERDRDGDRYKREPPFRPDSRNSGQSHTGPSTPRSNSMPSSQMVEKDRSTFRVPPENPEAARRQSAVPNLTSLPQYPRDDRNLSSLQSETSKDNYGPRTPSSPPQAPQVPAFGSLVYQPTPFPQSSATSLQHSRDGAPSSTPAKFDIAAIAKVVPTAPKAQLLKQAPTGPRAAQVLDKRLPMDNILSPGRGYDNKQDGRMMPRTGPSVVGSPSLARFSGSQVPTQNTLSSAARSIRGFDQPPAVQPPSKFGNFARAPGQSTFEGQGRFEQAELAIKTGLNSPTTQSTIQTASIEIPRGPKNMPLGRSNVPSIRGPMAMRASLNGEYQNMHWVNPALKIVNIPRGPSIMNTVPPTAGQQTVPAKRDYAGEERASASEPSWASQNAGHALVQATPLDRSPEISPNHTKESGQLEATRQHLLASPESTLANLDSRPIETILPSMAVDISVDGGLAVGEQASGSDEDEAMDLDEGDFEEAERKFSREMQALEAKRPATPRHHAELLPLLEELDALACAAEDLANGFVPEMVEIDEKLDVPRSTGLPSPKYENVDDDFRVDGNASPDLYETTNSRAESPLVESLPYLVSGPPTPFSELQVFQENLSHHEQIRSQIMKQIAAQRSAVANEHKELKSEYARFYKPWRIRVGELDKQKVIVSDLLPLSTSPAPAISPVVTPAPLAEGRRTGRMFVTEFELQKILEESKIAAEESAERQAQDARASALADLEKEATIPNMLDMYDAKMTMYKDTNHLIDTQLALEVLAFAPFQDDFTPEEHKIFTENYMAYPKKWGQIAEAIPGRDYQDCIQHYYLTKKDANYKNLLNRRLGKRGKGRVVRASQARPKSNALMSDLGGRKQLYDSNEFEKPQVAVTDTGRPRRAAAPTFGDIVGELEPVTPQPTPGRRGAASNKGDTIGDQTAERPANRRTRTTQPKEKGSKRGKAPLLAAAPGPSPQKKDTDSSRGKSKEPKLEDVQKTKGLEEGQILAGLQTTHTASTMLPQLGYTENWLSTQPTSLGPPGHLIPTQQAPQGQQQPLAEQQMQQQQQQQQQQQRGGSATSSYWSVPEQQDFCNLVGYFGTDWQAIANFLKGKTHIMVWYSVYYNVIL